MNYLWTHNVQKGFLAIAPLRTVSKGHRLKESFPTRCVPSWAVIWQTHEKHPVTTEENSLRDKGDSCTNIFPMPGLCRAVKCLVLNLLKPSYIKSPKMFPRKIKGIDLQNVTSQKVKHLVKWTSQILPAANFTETSWHCLKGWFGFAFWVSTSWLWLANAQADLSFSLQITKCPWCVWQGSRTAMSHSLSWAAQCPGTVLCQDTACHSSPAGTQSRQKRGKMQPRGVKLCLVCKGKSIHYKNQKELI